MKRRVILSQQHISQRENINILQGQAMRPRKDGCAASPTRNSPEDFHL